MTKSTIDTMPPDASIRESGNARRTRSWRDYAVRVGDAIAWFSRQTEKRRSRMRLLELTDEQLKDIGISRCDANGEAWRRFWE